MTTTVPHGTITGYTYHRCRCSECRAANTARAALGRRNRKHKQPPDTVHGTPGGYSNWGCRCEPCRLAERKKMQDYRARSN